MTEPTLTPMPSDNAVVGALANPSPHDSASLRGKSFILTGGSRGLGACVAQALGERGIDALAVPLDVGEEEQVQRCVAAACERFARMPERRRVPRHQAGLLGLSHALHAELRPQGIKVSAIVARGMRTPVRFVPTQPEETVIPELMVLPMRETSWP